MVTPHQIKAARALIDWSQSDLGQRTDISQAAIANIENGKHKPNDATEKALLKAFDHAGVEFIDGGVRLRPDGMEIIEGHDFGARMPDIYFETLVRHNAKEALINGVDYSVMKPETRTSVEHNTQRLIASGKSLRLLVRENTKRSAIIGPAEWHRALPDNIFSAVAPSFIYHNCFALMLVEKQRIIILRNADLAEHQRRQFDFLWGAAVPLKA